MILEKDKKKLLLQIQNLISMVEGYTPSFRFSLKRKRELLRLAADKPLAADIKVPVASYARLAIEHSPAPVKHFPIVSQLIERSVGQNSNALDQFAITAMSKSAVMAKKEIVLKKIAAATDQYLASLKTQDKEAVQAADAELEKIKTFEPQLHIEKISAEALRKYIHLLRSTFQFDTAWYYLEAVGEIIGTVTVYEDAMPASLANPLNVFYLPGETPTLVEDSPLVLENLYLDLYTIIDRFDLDGKTVKDLMKADTELRKGGTLQNNLGPIQSKPSKLEDVMGNIRMRISVNTTLDTEGEDYSSTTKLYKVQKLLVKHLKEKKKVYRTVIDTTQDSYTIESARYEPTEGEVVKPTYITSWTILYYVPFLEEIIFQREISNTNREAGKSDFKNPLYYGFVKTIDQLRPFSWLDSLESIIHTRNLALSKAEQLIADNLGPVFNLEYNARPSNMSLHEWLKSLYYSKIAFKDSTKIVQIGTNETVPIGNIIKETAHILSFDTSQNVMNMFNIVQSIDALLYTGKGLNDDARGGIGQNTRIETARYNVAQSQAVNTPTVKLFYLGIAGLYQKIVDLLRLLNVTQSLWINQLVGNFTASEELKLEIGSLSASALGVVISTNPEDISILNNLKQGAGMALQQKSISYSQYVAATVSRSAAEIADILQQAEALLQENQQKMQVAQQENLAKAEADKIEQAKEARRDELAADMAKALKEEERAIKVATIQKESDIAVALIQKETALLKTKND